MKIIKNRGYSVIVNSNTTTVTLTRSNSYYTHYISKLPWGTLVFDCTFREAINNLKRVKKTYSLNKKK